LTRWLSYRARTTRILARHGLKLASARYDEARPHSWAMEFEAAEEPHPRPKVSVVNDRGQIYVEVDRKLDLRLQALLDDCAALSPSPDLFLDRLEGR